MFAVVKFKKDLGVDLYIVYPVLILPFVLLSSRFEEIGRFNSKGDADFGASLLNNTIKNKPHYHGY